jgi:hypothetical protein
MSTVFVQVKKKCLLCPWLHKLMPFSVQFSEGLWYGLNRGDASKLLCKELTSSCKRKIPPLPKVRWQDVDVNAVNCYVCSWCTCWVFTTWTEFDEVPTSRKLSPSALFVMMYVVVMSHFVGFLSAPLGAHLYNQGEPLFNMHLTQWMQWLCLFHVSFIWS